MAPPATVTVYRHGLSAGFPGPGRGLRREVQGWTLRSSRANTRFLYSVREDALDGYGLSGSLTVRFCPPSAEAWKKLREAFLAQLRRLGFVRLHWLTEWQRRGVPHLHLAGWFPEPGNDYGRELLRLEVLGSWLALSGEYGSRPRAQVVKPMYGPMGWLQYVSKHGARGQAHYQRMRAGIPEGWQRTGRMWGHLGSWALQEPLRLAVDVRGWFYLRRAARGFLVAQARRKGRFKTMAAARRMLQAPDVALSQVRGIGGWIPESAGLGLLAYVATRGALVANACDLE